MSLHAVPKPVQDNALLMSARTLMDNSCFSVRALKIFWTDFGKFHQNSQKFGRPCLTKKMPTSYDAADEQCELFSFANRTWFDAVHGTGEFSQFNTDGYLPNIGIMSKTIQPKNILEIPLCRSKFSTTSIITTPSNYDNLLKAQNQDPSFKQFLQEWAY